MKKIILGLVILSSLANAAKAATFFGDTRNRNVISVGNGGTAKTVAWNTGLNQFLQTNATALTATFTAPSGTANLNLRIRRAGTVNGTVTWPATVKWASGAAPNLSNGVGAVDLIKLYFDGTNYYGDKLLNLS